MVTVAVDNATPHDPFRFPLAARLEEQPRYKIGSYASCKESQLFCGQGISRSQYSVRNNSTSSFSDLATGMDKLYYWRERRGGVRERFCVSVPPVNEECSFEKAYNRQGFPRDLWASRTLLDHFHVLTYSDISYNVSSRAPACSRPCGCACPIPSVGPVYVMDLSDNQRHTNDILITGGGQGWSGATTCASGTVCEKIK